jgi:hypothetical protein
MPRIEPALGRLVPTDDERAIIFDRFRWYGFGAGL